MKTTDTRQNQKIHKTFDTAIEVYISLQKYLKNNFTYETEIPKE